MYEKIPNRFIMIIAPHYNKGNLPKDLILQAFVYLPNSADDFKATGPKGMFSGLRI